MGGEVPIRLWHAGAVAITPPIPLVWAKLAPPRPPAELVERSDLLDRLADRDAALIAIVAPAGYGKTTAAAEVARRLGGETAWLALDPEDAEPVRFWTYVAAALASAGVSGADGVYQLLASEGNGPGAASLALRSAIEAHGRPVTLVLDDVQAVPAETIEDGIGQWLRHPVTNLRLVCASRADLPLPVGRLRSQGLLAEARIDDLAFDPAESEALLGRAFGLESLSADQLEAIDRRTQGWPVGLYLAGLTLRDEPDIARGLDRFTGDTRHLNQYLATEAVDGISDDARAFVLATSIVPVLHPALCDAVTDGVGSLRVLRQLAADNIFTSALDDGATVFQYHPLFREHLRSTLAERHPDQLSELHARASRWYEETGDGALAITHATAAGHTERAESLVLDRFVTYVNAGHLGTVTAWIDRLGSRRDRRSETALAMAWMSLNLRRDADIDQWLDIAAANAHSPAEAEMVAVQRPALLVHRARHRGDVGAMVRWAEEALSAESQGLLVDDDLHFAEAGRMAARSAAASAAFWSGDRDQARHLAETALALSGGDGAMSIEQVFCYQHLAAVEADAGHFDAALAHADQALLLVGPSQEATHQPTLAHLTRATVLAALGRPADAADALLAARRVAAPRPEPLDNAAIELQQAVLDHQRGDQDGARAAVRAAQAIVVSLPDPRFEERLRTVENTIRFVSIDPDALPVGARELTDRERAVLSLLPHKLSRRELARQLHVSENTVKTHLSSIRHKLGVTGRESIVDRAAELDLIPPPGGRIEHQDGSIEG